MRITLLLPALILLLAPGRARAEVVDSAATGFTVKLTFTLQASPSDVYRKLVDNIGDWWSADHTFSGNSHNLTIEEKPMGCFCEKLPNGGGVSHMEVVNFAPGKQLVLHGALGPLQSIAATGSMTIALSAVPGGNGGTKMDVTYTVVGYLPAGNEHMGSASSTAS